MLEQSSNVSPLMERLKLAFVVFVDIGGYLFPDHPDINTRPHGRIVRLSRCHCELWGHENFFIAANTRNRKDLFKDQILLETNKIFQRLNFTNPSLAYDYHFFECDGPESKGPKLGTQVGIRLNKGYKVLPVICDNRLLVAKHSPDFAHCIIFNEKDAAETEIRYWLDAVRPSNLHRVKTANEVAQISARIHLEFIRKAISEEGLESNQTVIRLFNEEARRVITLFRREGFHVGKIVEPLLFT